MPPTVSQDGGLRQLVGCVGRNGRVRGEIGVHWVQYVFSIVGYAWCSFISILSVSWMVEGECGEGERRVRGWKCFVEGYKMLSGGMKCCMGVWRVGNGSDCVLLCCFAEVARGHFVGVGECSEECGAVVEAYGFGYFLDWHVG